MLYLVQNRDDKLPLLVFFPKHGLWVEKFQRDGVLATRSSSGFILSMYMRCSCFLDNFRRVVVMRASSWGVLGDLGDYEIT